MIGLYYALVSLVNTLRLLGPYYLLQLVILYLQCLSVSCQIMLQLALRNICQIFLVGIPILVSVVAVSLKVVVIICVVVPVSVPTIVVVQIEVNVVSVEFFYSFPPSYLFSQRSAFTSSTSCCSWNMYAFSSLSLGYNLRYLQTFFCNVFMPTGKNIRSASTEN